MQVPIENIYYLLCYAWNKLEEKDLVKIEAKDTTSLVDLFAKVLIGGVSHLIKRGFDRGYVQHSEETRSLRGKIAVSATVKRNLLNRGLVHCEFDELSYDVLHNQILKSTIRNVVKVEGLDQSLQENLIGHYHRLQEVTEVELSKKVFSRVQLNRNNYFYDFLMRVCELLYTNLLPSEKSGEWKFRAFLEDEAQMRGLFEAFVRNFYKIEAGDYRVRREDIFWRLLPIDDEAAKFLPDMRTDITLTSTDRKLIVECKYTADIFQEYFGTPKFRSEHLYQLNAYLSNLPEGDLNGRCQGILLYPAAGGTLKREYDFPNGRKLSVRTINLNQSWQVIHSDLLAMVA